MIYNFKKLATAGLQKKHIEQGKIHMGVGNNLFNVRVSEGECHETEAFGYFYVLPPAMSRSPQIKMAQRPKSILEPNVY